METISINRIMARSFMNTLQYAMVIDQAAPVLQLDRVGALRFRLLSDAQLSVLYSLAAHVTDRNEVLAEYDLMINTVKEKSPDNAFVLSALTEGREALTELLIQAKSH
jgi:hypothetical protein